jgi:drug/metabolite transporter (DMT)-like permease
LSQLSCKKPFPNTLVLTGLLLLITVVWGWTFTVVKDAIAVYGVIAFLAVRFLIGSICLGAVGWRRMTRRSLLTGGAIGVVLASGYLFQTFGLRTTTATNSGLITTLFVVFAPLGSRVLYGVRTPAPLWAAIGLGLVGLVLLTGTGTSPVASGDWLTLGAAASFGLQIVLLSRHSKDHDPVALATGQVASATAIFLVAWPFTEPLAWPKGEVWWDLLLTGVVATAAGFYIQTLAQKQLSAARAAIIFTVEAVFAVFFGYVLAGDRLTAIQVAGAILVIGGVALAEIGPAVFSGKRAADP